MFGSFGASFGSFGATGGATLPEFIGEQVQVTLLSVQVVVVTMALITKR